ncbi:hypothetical protein [Nonomuraea dietziae]|uniref:hypothetical protein n=1 Tax=Nonomuraea dietziae TaxID=65515 RepID=UPI00344851D9
MRAPATVDNHLAHLSVLFTWSTEYSPTGLLAHGEPAKKVTPLRLDLGQCTAAELSELRSVPLQTARSACATFTASQSVSLSASTT